jgi:hypothetical protein
MEVKPKCDFNNRLFVLSQLMLASVKISISLTRHIFCLQAVATSRSGQVGQIYFFVWHVILALIRVTYEFANNVQKNH